MEDYYSWTSLLPFSSSAATVYKNGSVSTLSSVTTYDVYYYNTSMKAIWVYRNRVTGVYTAASPSTAAPSSVTVAGKTYTVSTTATSYALSSTGSYKIGNTVTLLGMNGDVVGVASSRDISNTLLGIVISTGTKFYTDNMGSTISYHTITVYSIDGNTYEYESDNNYVEKGDLVQVSFSGNKASITRTSDKTLSGTINASATTFGSYTFANDYKS